MTDDTVAIQAAIDSQSNHAVYLPRGTYLLTAPLKLKNNMRMYGDGPDCSYLNSEGTGYDDAMLLHEGEGGRAANVNLQNFSIRGGKYSLNITSAGCDSWNLENMKLFVTTDYGIVTNQWQVSKLENVTFYYTRGGFACNGLSNMNNFIDCEFVFVDRKCFLSQTCEVTNFIGCRFEALGEQEPYDINQATIEVTGSNNGLYFTGCYFERTHVTVLREGTPRDAVVFRDTHFTGGWNAADTGSFVPYLFESEGFVTLNSNTYFVKTVAPKYANILGTNTNLDVANTGYWVNAGTTFAEIHSPQLVSYPISNQTNLLRINATAGTGTLEDQVSLTGTLTLNVRAIDQAGLSSSKFSRKYHIASDRVASSQLDVRTDLISQSDVDISGRTVTLNTVTLSSREVYLVLNFSGFDPSDYYVCSWTFEMDSESSVLEGSSIIPSLYPVTFAANTL